ncbi:MAG: SIR2 family protein [bacterium]
MSNIFSVILGSGFSAPYGYPTAYKINKIISCLKEDDIEIFTSGSCRFKIRKTLNTKWIPINDTASFIALFLEFYNKEILISKDFNYEDFFDYYQDLLYNSITDERFLLFLNTRFNERYDRINQLMKFDDCFNQLISQLLHKKMVFKKFNNLTGQIESTRFVGFLYFLKYLIENNYQLKIHTLNHDLLLDYIFKYLTEFNKYDDGFSDKGSPFFCYNASHKKVFLQYFNNNFNSNICIYKLHGNLNFYFHHSEKNTDIIKVTHGLNWGSISKILMSENGKISISEYKGNFHPEFLSGRNFKISRSQGEHYYKPVFEHFKNNLSHSENLLVVGYSFRDKYINEIIKENYINKSNKRIVLIDNRNIANDNPFGESIDLLKKNISKVSKDELIKTFNL